MKRLFSLFLATIMTLVVSSSAYATDTPNTMRKISDVYGIPIEALATLDTEIVARLSDEMLTKEVTSSNDTYVKITYTENGKSIATEATYQEYLASTKMRDTDQCSWMRVHTTIIEIDEEYAQVSAAFTWLTRPSFRMNDVIGLSLTQGTFVDDSADGFYTWTTSQGSDEIDFTDTPSKFDYEGHGLVRNVTLAKPDYTVLSDYMFLRGQIHKESGSEGLNGTYGHQRASISISPSFDISREGTLSCVGINIGMTYDTYKGYTDTSWSM